MRLSKKRIDQFYHSRQWRTIRLNFLKSESICIICGDDATTVDHKIALSQGGDAVSISNLQSLCARCHGVKTARDQRAKKKYDNTGWLEGHE